MQLSMTSVSKQLDSVRGGRGVGDFETHETTCDRPVIDSERRRHGHSWRAAIYLLLNAWIFLLSVRVSSTGRSLIALGETIRTMRHVGPTGERS